MIRVFQRSVNGYILFDSAVLELLDRYKQYDNKSESGGILLGCYRGDHVEVVVATPPTKDDKSSRFRFIRKCLSHKKKAYDYWLSSNSEITYIGEWHTHPQNQPKPSTIDLKSWKRCTVENNAVFCIQGIDELWVGEIISKTHSVERLIEITDSISLRKNIKPYV